MGRTTKLDASQELLVLFHLQKHGKITPMSALHNYGVTRLAARIHDIRNRLWEVGSSMEIVTEIKEINGNRYAEYTLAKRGQ